MQEKMVKNSLYGFCNEFHLFFYVYLAVSMKQPIEAQRGRLPVVQRE